MNIVQLTPGAGGMYCGNCFRDNALVAALRRMGHETLLVPLYLPMTLDETPTLGSVPTFFGGINVFLSHQSEWYRHAPAWVRRWMDHPALLRFAAGRAAKTRAEDVGALNLSMLRGEEGNQVRELDDMVAWMGNLPHPDVVFLSNALLVGMARRIKERLKTRVIVFLQSEEAFLDAMTEPWRSKSWEALAERGEDVDAWISPSRYFADRMSERLGLPSEKVHVVHNGISLDGYRDIQRPVNDKPVLGFFARMCPDKGLDIVVDAFIELRRRGKVPDLQLHVGGGCGPSDVPFVNQLKQRLAQAGLADEARFFPNVTREEKVRFYAGCDVISVPSRQSEAFGLYVIEALAAGTPLVQPDATTFPELLNATGGGILFKGYRPDALADGVESLLLNRDRLRALGEAGRRAVFERFNDDVMARDIARLAAGLVGGADTKSPMPGSTQKPRPHSQS